MGLKSMLWVCGIILPFFFIKKGKRERERGRRKFVSLVFTDEKKTRGGRKKKQKLQKEEDKEEEEEEEEERERREKTTKQ